MLTGLKYHLGHGNVYFIDQSKTQGADEENGVIFLVIMFTPRVIVIKMSRMAHFLYYTLLATKNISQFEEIILLVTNVRSTNVDQPTLK